MVDARNTIFPFRAGWNDVKDGVQFRGDDYSHRITPPGASELVYRLRAGDTGHHAFVLDTTSSQWTDYNDV